MPTKQASALAMLQEAGRRLAPWAARPRAQHLHRWGFGQVPAAGGLAAPIHLVHLRGGQLALFGDFLAAASGLENAWLSGHMLAQRLGAPKRWPPPSSRDVGRGRGGKLIVVGSTRAYEEAHMFTYFAFTAVPLALSAAHAPSLSPLATSAKGCRWQVTQHSHVDLEAVPCEAVRTIALGTKSHQAVITAALTTHQTVVKDAEHSGMGIAAEVDETTTVYRVFHATLKDGSVRQLPLPNLPDGARAPAMVAGFDRDNRLQLVATGPGPSPEQTSLWRWRWQFDAWAAVVQTDYSAAKTAGAGVGGRCGPDGPVVLTRLAGDPLPCTAEQPWRRPH